MNALLPMSLVIVHIVFCVLFKSLKKQAFIADNEISSLPIEIRGVYGVYGRVGVEIDTQGV